MKRTRIQVAGEILETICVKEKEAWHLTMLVKERDEHSFVGLEKESLLFSSVNLVHGGGCWSGRVETNVPRRTISHQTVTNRFVPGRERTNKKERESRKRMITRRSGLLRALGASRNGPGDPVGSSLSLFS